MSNNTASYREATHTGVAIHTSIVNDATPAEQPEKKARTPDSTGGWA